MTTVRIWNQGGSHSLTMHLPWAPPKEETWTTEALPSGDARLTVERGKFGRLRLHIEPRVDAPPEAWAWAYLKAPPKKGPPARPDDVQPPPPTGPEPGGAGSGGQ